MTCSAARTSSAIRTTPIPTSFLNFGRCQGKPAAWSDGMMRISICGGGSLSHAVAAVLGARGDVEVRVLTRQPERWSRHVRAIYLDIAEIRGRIAVASSDPEEAVAGADMVILCVPSCAREQ